MEGKGIAIRSLARSILGHARAPWCGLKQVSHGHTRTHKIQHSLNLGEATTFSLIVFFVINHKGCIQMSFCLKTSNLGVQFWNSWNWDSLLHIVPFCKRPNKKPKGFVKQKQPTIFAMRHASQLVEHHPLLIYNVPYFIAALLRHIPQIKLCVPLSLRPP